MVSKFCRPDSGSPQYACFYSEKKANSLQIHWHWPFSPHCIAISEKGEGPVLVYAFFSLLFLPERTFDHRLYHDMALVCITIAFAEVLGAGVLGTPPKDNKSAPNIYIYIYIYAPPQSKLNSIAKTLVETECLFVARNLCT